MNERRAVRVSYRCPKCDRTEEREEDPRPYAPPLGPMLCQHAERGGIVYRVMEPVPRSYL